MKHGKESSPNVPGHKRETKQGGESDLSGDVILDMNLKARKERERGERVVMDMIVRPNRKARAATSKKNP